MFTNPRLNGMSGTRQLLRRRWNMKPLTSDHEQLDLHTLEKDLVTAFIVGKPRIKDPSKLRLKYQFKIASEETIE